MTGEAPSTNGSPPAAPLQIAIPRHVFVRDFLDDPGPCPRCGGKLEQASAAVLLLTRRRPLDATQAYVAAGEKLGRFCRRCPSAVLSESVLEERLQALYPGASKASYALIGIIDVDAIPPDQRHLPLNEVDPLPLREFIHGEAPIPDKPPPKFVQDRARQRAKKLEKKRRR
jgi:hypothetical protein